MTDPLLLVGGVIPRDHAEQLRALGVDEVFTPGTMMSDIVRFVRERARRMNLGDIPRRNARRFPRRPAFARATRGPRSTRG